MGFLLRQATSRLCTNFHRFFPFYQNQDFKISLIACQKNHSNSFNQTNQSLDKKILKSFNPKILIQTIISTPKQIQQKKGTIIRSFFNAFMLSLFYSFRIFRCSGVNLNSFSCFNEKRNSNFCSCFNCCFFCCIGCCVAFHSWLCVGYFHINKCR